MSFGTDGHLIPYHVPFPSTLQQAIPDRIFSHGIRNILESGVMMYPRGELPLEYMGVLVSVLVSALVPRKIDYLIGYTITTIQ